MESAAPEIVGEPEAVQKVKVVCVYRTGGDYNADYVRRLAVGVHNNIAMPHDFICLSDDPEVAGVGSNLPLAHNWPGWWAVMELYRIRGPALYFDLDTVIVGDITPLAQWAIDNPKDIASLRGFKGEWSATGILAWGGDQSRIHRHFSQDVLQGSLSVRGGLQIGNGHWSSDQNWIDAHSYIHTRINDFFPYVYSYKHHCKRGLPEGARVICFHGHPRPSEVKPRPDWLGYA